jgi:hypothetical protein
MKKIELKVTLYLKEDIDLSVSYVKITEICENVGNALLHSDNVTNDIEAIEVKNPITSAITGEFFKEV